MMCDCMVPPVSLDPQIFCSSIFSHPHTIKKHPLPHLHNVQHLFFFGRKTKVSAMVVSLIIPSGLAQQKKKKKTLMTPLPVKSNRGTYLKGHFPPATSPRPFLSFQQKQIIPNKLLVVVHFNE